MRVRNLEQWSELIGYLEKHQSEIINYSRRRLVAKTIGDGRMEKGVDLTVRWTLLEERYELETQR